MLPMPAESLYSLGQVAAMVGASVLRVRNLSTTVAYGLAPSAQVGTGRGSRRLFTFRDVQRIYIADSLFQLGYAPAEVGAALAQVRARNLTGNWVLIRDSAGWYVSLDSVIRHPRPGYFELSIRLVLDSLNRRIAELEAQGTAPSRNPKRPNRKGTK